MTLDGFEIYLGFCFYSGMVRSTGREMTAIEKIVCFLTVSRGRDLLHYAGPHGKTPGSSGNRNEGNTWTRAFTVVFMGRNR